MYYNNKMCGIIGVLNKETAANKEMINGLKKMEYRGYDSAGIIFLENFEIYKSIGSIENLEKAVEESQGKIGLGHTRWATHGQVSILNTHPIKIGKYAIIHNGIVEDFEKLLKESNHPPQTQTDTESLIAYYAHLRKNNDIEMALKKIIENVKGSYAAAILEHGIEKILWLKKGVSPIALAETAHGYVLASDEEGMLNPEKIYTINSDGYGYLSKEGIKILRGEVKTRQKMTSKEEIEKNTETFLEKEIEDQRLIFKNQMGKTLKKNFEQYNNIDLIACGSSFFAAEIGAIWLNEENYIASASIASEWNVSKTSTKANQLAIFISQSGFTADTLSALYKAKKTHTTLSLVNKENSPIGDETNETIFLEAGNEKSVAASKSFSAQLIKLYQLIKGKLPEKLEEKIDAIFKIDINQICEHLSKSKEIIILGKNKMSIIAKEAMLKLTEITYLNIFAYPAGELKHGYIAKITKNVTTIILAPEDEVLLQKTISSGQEVKCRNGEIILISSENHLNTKYFLQTPKMNYDEAVFCYTILIQRITLKVAEILKRPIDKPRNLAKSVTVE